MPKPGQKTVTFTEVDLDKILDICEKEGRTVVQLLKFLIWESFGTKEQAEKAHNILVSLREKYP